MCAGAPPSPPPSPPTAFTSTALKTALAAKFRLIGPGVTPFDTNKQKILLYAVGYTIANVDFDKLRITNVQVSWQEIVFRLATAASLMTPASVAAPCSLPPFLQSTG